MQFGNFHRLAGIDFVKANGSKLDKGDVNVQRARLLLKLGLAEQ